MTPAQEMILKAREVRQRLRRPPNAVEDTGINLYPTRIPPRKIIVEPPTPLKKKFKPEVQVYRKLGIMKILSVVTQHFSISMSEIRGRSRAHRYMRPRQIAWYLISKHKIRSASKTAAFFDRNHTTVLDGIRVIAETLLVDENMRNLIELLEGDILEQDRDEDTVAAKRKRNMAYQQGRESPQSDKIQGVVPDSGLGS